jgi:hypothetical protein
MKARIAAAALMATVAAFVASPAPVFACQKCQFVEQGFQCTFSSVSCCAVINGNSCESGPCSIGCGSRFLPGVAPDSAVAQAGCSEPAALPSEDEGKRARSVVLPARR